MAKKTKTTNTTTMRRDAVPFTLDEVGDLRGMFVALGDKLTVMASSSRGASKRAAVRGADLVDQAIDLISEVAFRAGYVAVDKEGRAVR